MNRVEFMAQLERLLIDLPENERQDALCYYNDYFDDAGEENEGKVIQELGSPGKVAAIIRASYRNGSSGEDQGEYTENGYRDTQFSEKGQMPAPHRNRNQNQQEERRSWWEEQREKRKEEQHFYSESAEFQKEDWLGIAYHCINFPVPRDSGDRRRIAGVVRRHFWCGYCAVLFRYWFGCRRNCRNCKRGFSDRDCSRCGISYHWYRAVVTGNRTVADRIIFLSAV